VTDRGHLRDDRTAEEFAAALWRETDRSIAEDLRRHGEVRRRRGMTLAELSPRSAAYDGRRFDPRSETRQERILALLAEAGPLTRGQVAERLGIAGGYAYDALSRLRRAGKVVSEEAGPKETGYLWRLADPTPTSGP
jgi:DNA-binding CsgD family transcriptional regulator